MPVRTNLRPAERGLREAVRGVDAAIRQVEKDAVERIKELRADRRVLEKARGDLRQPNGSAQRHRRKRRRTKNKRTHEDFVKLAGRANVEKVRGYLENHGRAFQSKITKDLDLPSGNVSHALRALASDPDGSLIRVTGEVQRGSKEFEYLGKAKDEEIATDENVVASVA